MQILSILVGFLVIMSCAAKVAVTVKADSFPKICKQPTVYSFNLSGAATAGAAQAAYTDTANLFLTKGGENDKITLECKIPEVILNTALTDGKVECKTTGTITTLVDFYIGEALTNDKISCDADTTKKIAVNTDYIALAATQTSISVDYTKKTDATHPFTILYTEALPTTGTAPVVKANNAACVCTYPATDATGDALKTLSCTFKATDLPADTDATKKKTYPVSVTDACGALEESGLIITINSVKLVLSKFALILAALILL